MATFLFAWNPKNWPWNHLSESIEAVNSLGFCDEKWSVISHRQIRVGDRAFLIRLGTNPKGIMASGLVMTEPFLSEHWSDNGKLVKRVIIKYDTILHPEKDTLLNLSILNEKIPRNWTIQSSGIKLEIDESVKLEDLWMNHLADKYRKFVNYENKDKDIFLEGAISLKLTTRYERNISARERCIEYYGVKCSVCDLSFEDQYGTIGKDFIHIHHINPISVIKEQYRIDPIRDLRPVCPNCHAMIHKRTKPYSIKEMKEILIK